MTKIRIALFFADGRAYFVGAGIVIAALVLSCLPRSRVTRTVARAGLIPGVLLIVLSSAPLPIWLYIVWAGTALAAVVVRTRKRSKSTSQWICIVAALACCVLCVLWEAGYTGMPHVRLGPERTIYIIGDSLSAGLTNADVTWPKVLQRETAFMVADCSQAGATVESAMTQSRRVQPGPAVVILEIGGNDLLGSTTAAEFERGLTRLLECLYAPDRQLLMFELPLPPLSNAYGRIQRRLASEHGVYLIPKRVLAEVLGLEGGTSDGLHFSDAGHRVLAERIREIFSRGSGLATSPW